MGIRLRHLFLTLFLLAATLPAWGQGKVYTRKLRLADFPTKTTKMVLAGNSFLELTLREGIAVHWRISPYEFCSPEDYRRLSSSSSYYFLSLAQDRGIIFLVLTKGGKEGEKDQLKQAFEVVRMPIAGADDPSGRELVMMGAFLDIIQTFVERAMLSDRAAYGGISATAGPRLDGRTVYLNPDAADAAILSREPDALAGVVIAPADPAEGPFCYKMLISTDTYELFFYEKCRYRTPADARFTEAELQRFRRRGAKVL
ncbi:MAG: hypothetical protein IKX28_04185 [Bacteroidales bacterium]|nr:hypothetical protein [Bacteroidales bacterium]